VMSFLIFSIINLGILMHFQPFQDKSANKVEILNEVTIYLCNTAVYCIMNDGNSEVFREFMGDQLMYICILNMLINLLIVIYSTITQFLKKAKEIIRSRKEAERIREEIKNDLVCTKYFPGQHSDKARNLK
jgi:hypothetical protein